MFFPVMKSIIISGSEIRYHIDDASNNNKLLCLASIESMTKPKKIYPQWILRFKQGISYLNDFEYIRYRNNAVHIIVVLPTLMQDIILSTSNYSQLYFLKDN